MIYQNLEIFDIVYDKIKLLFFGITDNIEMLLQYYRQIIKILFKWLNRRSQKRSYTWEQFKEMLEMYPLAKPKIYVNIYDI